MTRFRKMAAAARLWLPILAALAVAPTAAAARDCTSQYIQCFVDGGSDTMCAHEYIACISQAILEY